MNSKLKTFALFLLVVATPLFTSCEDDEDNFEKPVISELELGLDDSHLAYIGGDLHIEAEIVAEAKISTITVEIHQEEGSSDEIEVVYDEFEGLKNTTFHKHVDIPETMIAGEYHCHIIVTDMEGNQTTVEDEIDLETVVDETAPIVSVASAPAEGDNFIDGEAISISGNISDDNSLGGMVVALVYTADSIADEDVTGSNSKVIVMLHTHTFDSEAAHDFNASITVGASDDNNMTPAPLTEENDWKTGNYYILVKAKDALGNWGYSDHYPITINE